MLALHELVLDALDRGVLVAEGGLWQLTGPLLGTGQATGVVQARLGALDDESRRVLELLSVAEELGLPDLEARFSMACLEHLEQQGIITVTPDGRRTTLRIGHPLYADAVRASLPFLRLRRLRSEVIDLLEGHGAPPADRPGAHRVIEGRQPRARRSGGHAPRRRCWRAT